MLVLMAFVGVASASASQFRAEKYEASVTGSQVTQQTIVLNGAKVTCQKFALSGGLASAASVLPLTPSGTSCKFAGLSATINPQSCQIALSSTNNTPPYTGSWGVNCSKGGDAISIAAPTMPCTVTIPAQAGHNSVEFGSSGLNANRRITASLNVSGMEYTEMGSGCPGGAGTFGNGTVTGSYSLGGETPGGGPKIGVYIANEQIAAGPTEVRAESFPLGLLGEGTAKLTAAGFNLGGSLGLRGELSASSSTVKLTTGWSKWNATVTGNGCYFVAHLASETTGSMDVACEKAGSAITFNVSGSLCKIEIPAQTGLNALGFTNEGSGATRSILTKLQITGMTYTQTGVACSGGSGTFKNGLLTSEVLLPGYENLGGTFGAQEGAWLE
jgi:hypothetical protein